MSKANIEVGKKFKLDVREDKNEFRVDLTWDGQEKPCASWPLGPGLSDPSDAEGAKFVLDTLNGMPDRTVESLRKTFNELMVNIGEAKRPIPPSTVSA